MTFLIPKIFIGLVVFYLTRLLIMRKKTPAPLPPGPPSKPIIGNLKDLPPQDAQEWQHWLKHKEVYGPISSVTVFGQTLIILNEARLAIELMEKRSAIHSSRPTAEFIDMAGWNHAIGALQYTDRFRATRKNIHRVIGGKASVARFNSMQEAEVGRFLYRVLERPDDLVYHLRKEAGAVILKLSYGYTVEPHGRDPLVDLADKAMEDFASVITPGAWIVNFVPMLRYLPSWFPGTSFKTVANGFKKSAVDFCDRPCQFVKRQMAQNRFDPSFLSRLLGDTQCESGSGEESIIKWSAASLYAGGADTSVSIVSSFFLAMTLYPEVQKKAQVEIDEVIGTDRLPGFDDRESLPYTNALVKEAFRWHPVGPMGIPHSSTEDDMCDGYFIPKGSVLLANIWFVSLGYPSPPHDASFADPAQRAFTHDPKTYPDPMAFKPERFLHNEGHVPESDPYQLSFGFGRRACPGRTLADSNVYLNIVQSLAVFNISKAVRDGKEVDVQPVFQAGSISHPAPFECSITPRSAGHEALIRAAEKDYPLDNGDAEELGQANV